MFIVIENTSYNLLFWTSPRIMTEKYSAPMGIKPKASHIPGECPKP